MFGNLDVTILLLRIVGLLLIGHGAQKLFGWFGGHGLAGTARWFESIGIRPARFWALLAGLAEFAGGIGLALGLLTAIAAAAIVSVMVMAIIKVHWAHGLWVTQGGFEYPLVIALVATFLGLSGPGRYALDSWLHISYPMPLTFWAALLAGLAGVLVALVSQRAVLQPQHQS